MNHSSIYIYIYVYMLIYHTIQTYTNSTVNSCTSINIALFHQPWKRNIGSMYYPQLSFHVEVTLKLKYCCMNHCSERGSPEVLVLMCGSLFHTIFTLQSLGEKKNSLMQLLGLFFYFFVFVVSGGESNETLSSLVRDTLQGRITYPTWAKGNSSTQK